MDFFRTLPPTQSLQQFVLYYWELRASTVGEERFLPGTSAVLIVSGLGERPLLTYRGRRQEAHFARDFRAMIGVPPSRFREEALSIANLFRGDRSVQETG